LTWTPLGAAGFERGWSPWWMAARIGHVGPAEDERVELVDHLDDGPVRYRAELALTGPNRGGPGAPRQTCRGTPPRLAGLVAC
jgi:hypothetical protein